MCVGNRAQSSIIYVNGQLNALYTNAKKCVGQHLRKPYLKPDSTSLYYGVALNMGFEGVHKESNPSTDDLAFYTSFGQPEIEFPCNHEVILRLKLDSGHYYLDPANVATRTDFANKRSIGKWEVEVHIPFSESSSLIENDAIGNVRLYDLSYIILSMDKAVFDDFRVQSSHKSAKLSPDNAAALQTYLSRYLMFLKHAGYHVFYTLPDFDDVEGTDPINYSLATHADGVPILNITVENMTKYLASRWTEAMYRSDKYAKFRYLSEVQSTVEDVKFSVSFREPVVKALCEHEVALIFDIKEVQFVKANVKAPFNDWKIAFLVGTDLEQSRTGQTLKINVSTAKYYSYLSASRTTLTAEGKTLQEQLITYLRGTYLKQFEIIHGALIYDSGFTLQAPPPRPRPRPRPPPEGTEVGCWTPSGCPHSGSKGHVCWGRSIGEMIDYKGPLPYDFTTSVTQGSLNAQFAWFWTRAKGEVDVLKRGSHLSWEHALAQFRYPNSDEFHFEASFKAPQIQLVCSKGSRTAIVHLFVESGRLKPLLGGKTEPDISAEDYSFGAWRVSFRVPLELRTCTEVSRLPGFVRTHFGRNDFRNFKQLVLNFAGASFFNMYSLAADDSDDDFEGLLSGEKHRALLAYLKMYYFPSLVNNGHDILHTIPVGYSLDRLSLTGLDWQISSIPFGASDQFVDGIGGRYERNAILFLGMTGHHPLPKLTQYPFWITAGFGSEIPSATAVLSRELGVDGLLVPLLSAINRDTTLVLGSPRFESGLWIPDVSTWSYQAAQRQSEDCKFKLVDGGAEALNFEWSNVESWKYERGPANGAHSSWSIYCSTLNKLSIPTGTVNGACVISLEGHTTLKLESDFKADSSHGSWSSEAQSDWSTTITLEMGVSGIKLATPSNGEIPVKPNKESGNIASSGNPNALDAAQLLQERLPKVHVGDIVTGLQRAFDGVWGYFFASTSESHVEGVQAGALCARSPVFTKGGHLILELRQYEVAQTQWAQIPLPNIPLGEMSSNGSAHGRNGSIASIGTQILDSSLPTSPTRTNSKYGDTGTRTPVLAASNPNSTLRGLFRAA